MITRRSFTSSNQSNETLPNAYLEKTLNTTGKFNRVQKLHKGDRMTSTALDAEFTLNAIALDWR